MRADREEWATYAVLSDICDIFRLLIGSMDFLEEDGDSWLVLLDLCFSTVLARGNIKVKPDLLLWMLQMPCFEPRTNVIEWKYAEMLHWILRPEAELTGAVDLLFTLGGASIIDVVAGSLEEYALLHFTLALAEQEDFVSPVVARGPNLHPVCFCDSFTPYEESPTSLAMYSSRAFSCWLHALVKIEVDFESFIDQELEQNPKVHAGWGKETLLDLFTHGDRPDLH